MGWHARLTPLLLLLLLFIALASFMAENPFWLFDDEYSSASMTVSGPDPTLAPTPFPLWLASAPARIQGLHAEHVAAGRPYAFGLRGISFVYAHLGHVYLASPQLQILVNRSAIAPVLLPNKTLEFDIENITPGPCFTARQLSRVTLWVRLTGPEITATIATPVPNQCKFHVSFPVTLSGQYNVYARLIHYNAPLPMQTKCEFLPAAKLSTTYISLLYDFELIPFHWRSDTKCCDFCARIANCTHSIRPIPVRRSAPTVIPDTTHGEQRCLFFRQARSSDEPGAFAASEVFKRFNLRKRPWPDSYCKATGVMVDVAGSEPRTWETKSWQLHCGRDELLFKAAPCGSFGSGFAAANMPLTEDIVLFEHETLLNLVVPGAPTPQDLITQALAPTGGLPFCKASETPMHMGRYVRVPSDMLAGCGPMPEWKGSNGNLKLLPPLDPLAPPLCASRHALENISAVYSQWGPFNVSKPGVHFTQYDFHVYRSQLSDSPLEPDQIAKRPLVPGPLAVIWILWPEAQCRKRPWLSFSEISTCFEQKDISRILGKGQSIIEFTMGALVTILRMAMPDKRVDFPGLHKWSIEIMSARGAMSKTTMSKLVVISNLQAPHLVGLPNLDSLIVDSVQTVDNLNDALGGTVWKKIFFTPGMVASERWNGQHHGNFDRVARIASPLLRQQGWITVDYKPLTVPFVFETTPEGDTLHHVGPPLLELAYELLSTICSDD